MNLVFVASIFLLAACDEGSAGVPVPSSVDPAELDAECIDALMISAAAQTCANYCVICEPERLGPCSARCSMGEVVVANLRLAEDLVCWDRATACDVADLERCSEPDDWIDFDHAIEECADDVKVGSIRPSTQ